MMRAECLVALFAVASCSDSADSRAVAPPPSASERLAVETTESTAAAPTGASPTGGVHDTPAGMVRVAAGDFEMGCVVGRDIDCSRHERPVHVVYLDAYLIDETEVTVASYRSCVEDGGCSDSDVTKQRNVGGRYVDCNWGLSGRDNHPMNCVTWTQATACCRHSKKRLPTEAEWEKAARGSDARMFPWGNELASEQRAVHLRLQARPLPPSAPELSNSTWPVGSKRAGASPCGALDMAGNVWEWTADWYDATYYTVSPRRNPAGPSSGSYRVIRGNVLPLLMRSTFRGKLDPAARMGLLGFRCAKDASS